MSGEWLKFNNRDFTLDSRKEFKKRLAEIQKKEIKCPEGLDFEEFDALYERISLQNLNQFWHVSFEQDDGRIISQACNRLFRIKEQVVREYVMDFLSSFTFRDHIKELDEVDTLVFQLGKEKRSMTMRQFIQALGLYTHQEMNNNLFEPFYESCYRSRPTNYNPTQYVINITTHANYDIRHPLSYNSIRNPIRRLVHRLLTLSVAGRHIRKEKVTLDDLFLLHSMDGGVSVDVHWHVAKFLCDKAKGSKKKSPIVGAHLIGKIASSIPINRSLIQAIPTSLPPHLIGEARKASNLQRIPPGVQGSFDPFVEIPFGESKVHIEVLSALWGNRLPIPDGSLPLSRKVNNFTTPVGTIYMINSIHNDEPSSSSDTPADESSIKVRRFNPEA
ncbi:hypothetical protein Tco_0899785 [Tanacetum coccineum]